MISCAFRKKCFITLILLYFFFSSLWANEPHPNAYAVVSAHPLATQAGLEILAHGGNAFDAAVAVSAALAVVEPYHSGLGGGGFWLLHDAHKGKDIFIDGREVAPKAASRNMFLDAQGKPIPFLSLNGGLAAAIPGEPAALVYIAKHYGRLSLAQSLAPAIRYAEKGFVVEQALNDFLMMDDRLIQLKKYPASSAIFLYQGAPYPIGSLLIQKDLAHTLRAIANHGVDGFYRGVVAKKLVAGVHHAGGIWTLQDLADYHIKVRVPFEGKYHHMRVITAPLPSSGGINLLTMLHLLSQYPLHDMSKIQKIHYLIEVMRLAYWQDYQWMGDSDFVKVPIAYLLSPAHIKTLSHYIQDHHATSSDTLPKTVTPRVRDNQTTHFSILDKEGNRVSATLSINYIFGSSVVADGTGVLLNDTMDDFSIKPGVKNVFGLVGGEPNAILPGKRPVSHMAPTFLEMDDRIAILGTPGGSRIPSMVLLASLACYDGYGAISMVSTMRFHHQFLPDYIQFEPDTFSKDMQEGLKAMGYHLYPLKQYYGDMQAITWDKESNLITAASDPRHIGRGTVVNEGAHNGYGFTH